MECAGRGSGLHIKPQEIYCAACTLKITDFRDEHSSESAKRKPWLLPVYGRTPVNPNQIITFAGVQWG
jgi:GH25 family lysozyme M1 (1,4-beta-N-acetylmuramidase)